MMETKRPWRRRRFLAVFLAAMASAGMAICQPRSAGASAADDAPLLVIETQRGPAAFTVEVADTPLLRQKGLQYRQTLGETEGMLFDFGKTQPVAMWMKDTFIPLDMLFIDWDGVIVGIATGTEPHSLTPIRSPGPVRWVLELAGGATERLGIAVGDRLGRPPRDDGGGTKKP